MLWLSIDPPLPLTRRKLFLPALLDYTSLLNFGRPMPSQSQRQPHCLIKQPELQKSRTGYPTTTTILDIFSTSQSEEPFLSRKNKNKIIATKPRHRPFPSNEEINRLTSYHTLNMSALVWSLDGSVNCGSWLMGPWNQVIRRDGQ
jgi:hypothetical protein